MLLDCTSRQSYVDVSYSPPKKKVFFPVHLVCLLRLQLSVGLCYCIWNMIGPPLWRDLFSSNHAQGICSVWALLTEPCSPISHQWWRVGWRKDETEWDMEVNEDSLCLEVIFITSCIIQWCSTLTYAYSTDTQTPNEMGLRNNMQLHCENKKSLLNKIIIHVQILIYSNNY